MIEGSRKTENRRPGSGGGRAGLVLAVGLVLFVGAARAGWKGGSAGRREAGAEGPSTAESARGSERQMEGLRLERGILRSNLSLLEILTREAVEAAADSLELAEGCSLTVMATQWHEGNWFAGNLLAEALALRGHVVRVFDASEAGGNGTSGSGQPGAAAEKQGKRGAGSTGPALGAPTPAGLTGTGSPGDTTGAYADSIAAELDPLWGQPTTGGEAAPQENQGQAVESPGKSPAEGQGDQAAQEAAPSKPALPRGQLVDLRILEFGVSYANVGRVFLFGPLRFTRVGGVSLQVTQMLGPSGEMQKVVLTERHQVDRLSGTDRVLAEGASYPFTAPALKPSSLGRYIEPAVVVAIVSSLVYLFYKNQN